jgi:hypothetical protein
MRLPIVDTRTIPEELDYLYLARLDGTSKVRGRLEVLPAGEELRARLSPAAGHEHHVSLDAEFAGELASAARLLAGRDELPAGTPVAGDWRLVVELGWSGMRRSFELSSEPAEDALRAVARRLEDIFDGDAALHLREVRGRAVGESA